MAQNDKPQGFKPLGIPVQKRNIRTFNSHTYKQVGVPYRPHGVWNRV